MEPVHTYCSDAFHAFGKAHGIPGTLKRRTAVWSQASRISRSGFPITRRRPGDLNKLKVRPDRYRLQAKFNGATS